MNYHDIAPYVAMGFDAQQIADGLNRDPRHHRNAYITGGPANTSSVSLLHLLTVKFRVLFQDSTQSWQGPLVEAAKADREIAAVMALLYPHLQVVNSEVFSHNSADSADMLNAITEVVGQLVDDDPDTELTADSVRDAVAILTGGRMYGEVTAAEVQDLIDSHAAVDLLADAHAKLDAWHNAGENEKIRDVAEAD